MKKSKKMLIIVSSLLIILGCGIGVSAATGGLTGKSAVSKGIFRYNNNEVVVDGNSVGYWLNGNYSLPADWAADAYITIDDADLKVDSFVDIYYAENCKDLVAKSRVEYDQQEGSVKIIFHKAAPAGNNIPISIEAIHVVNPVNNPIP